MVSLQDYVTKNERAIMGNNPTLWPAYESDPIAVWRYIARCFGHGLAGYDERQVISVVQTLYGNWFIRSEFHHKIPNISAKMWAGWILDAMHEAQNGK